MSIWLFPLIPYGIKFYILLYYVYNLLFYKNKKNPLKSQKKYSGCLQLILVSDIFLIVYPINKTSI
ncbi:hypothetical protein CTM_18375 [Clostridium tetanomorphum DSM 665]|nr:hypothetical protein CTM_18375 [Clostridium tetanomorphum DSM 665]